LIETGHRSKSDFKSVFEILCTVLVYLHSMRLLTELNRIRSQFLKHRSRVKKSILRTPLVVN